MSVTFIDEMNKEEKTKLSSKDLFIKFLSICGYSLLFLFMLIINLISLSICLNMNRDKPFSIKLVYAIFAFFFGYIYLLVSVFYYRMSVLKQNINFDKNKIFEF